MDRDPLVWILLVLTSLTVTWAHMRISDLEQRIDQQVTASPTLPSDRTIWGALSGEEE